MGETAVKRLVYTPERIRLRFSYSSLRGGEGVAFSSAVVSPASESGAPLPIVRSRLEVHLDPFSEQIRDSKRDR